jgi:competence protein ComEC
MAGVPLVLIGAFSPLMARPPDLLVSADAKLIAIRTTQGAFAEAKSDVAFTRSSWEQLWRVASLASMAEGQIADPSDVLCDADSCVLRSRLNGPAALLLRGTATQSACDHAQIILSSEPIRTACQGFMPTIDRFTVWRDGAQAVWLSPSGVVILSDRADRGSRPWVARTPARLVATTLPLAPRLETDY